jgi:hypothetical protein
VRRKITGDRYLFRHRREILECICSGSIETQYVLPIELFDAICSLFMSCHTFEFDTPVQRQPWDEELAINVPIQHCFQLNEVRYLNVPYPAGLPALHPASTVTKNGEVNDGSAICQSLSLWGRGWIKFSSALITPSLDGFKFLMLWRAQGTRSSGRTFPFLGRAVRQEISK